MAPWVEHLEVAKNQRAVETRLKEALHYDRARVQMGKISRFGLMELSRQRLRPALNEGSHVTCPRCNGVGVIRDTESSALHILRILQEEAMKESTAAVHAQVPVEVAAFLLNEKRGDIAKLEARLRVSIVLIPNKFLDTPHYHVERLRHDDPRLDEVKASFERAAELAPSTDTPYTRGKADDERSRPKQEAVVKGIVPETPAPIVAPPAAAPAQVAAAPQSGGFWRRIVGFFTGETAVQPAPVAALPAPAASRPQRDSEGRGERRRGQDRDRRDGRRDDKREDRRGERKDARRGEKRGERPAEAARPEREQRAARQETSERSAEREGRKPPQERRGERKDKPAVVEEAAAIAAAQRASAEVGTPTTATLVSPDAATVDVTAEEQRGRRRRRRRGRGARGADGESAPSPDLAETDTDQESIEATTAAMPAEPAAAPVQVAARDDKIETSRQPEPAAAPAAPAAAIAASVVLPIALPAPMPVEQLKAMLGLAGLSLVQTEPDKLEQAHVRMSREPESSHVPRERPVLPPLDTRPLIQIETRKAQ